MFTSLDLFRMAHAMATHAGTRQSVVATNIANADTPGYRARDIIPFAEAYQHGEGFGMRATRARHLNAADTTGRLTPFIADSEDTSPNGNAVSLEQELLKGVDTQRQHEKALAIYRSGLTILRTSIGRG